MRMPSPNVRGSVESQIQRFETALETADGVLSYLADRLITPDTAKIFRLGYNPDKKRLSIPYLSPAGPWNIKYRCVSHDGDCEGHAKYLYETEADMHLFNASVLLDAERVVVTEGELDTVLATQIGLSAVAYPGTQNWQKHFKYCFDSVDEAVVVADGDEPGVKAAKRVVEDLRSAIGGDVRLVVMPPGHDLSSYVKAYDEWAALEMLEML